MEYKRVGDTILFRLDSGEELVGSIEKICEKQHIVCGWVQGIGAADELTIGVFETKEKKYHNNKTDLCLEKNIQLIHIYEDDWIYKQDIIKSMILISF